MTIRYPNGASYQLPSSGPSLAATNRHQAKPTSFGGRGMTLEEEINESNAYYRSVGKAVIHKKPTPVQIVKVDYPKRSAAVIREAYFRQASTTDYNGVYRGHYIDFDAKETRNHQSFPLKNFHEHQIKHMRECLAQGGVCFALIRFVAHQELYVLKASDLFTFWDAAAAGGRQSIPLATIRDQAIKLSYHVQPVIPYLDAVDQLIDLNQQG